LQALSTCLPKGAWARHAAALHADGVPRKDIRTALQLALQEALLGERRVRSWGRWLRVVANAPEPVDEASRRRFDSWLVALKPLRARLADLGAPACIEDAPGIRDALTALTDASDEGGACRAPEETAQGASDDARRAPPPHGTWGQVLLLYGGNSTLTLLEDGSPVPPTPVSLEYRLWAEYGAEALVQVKAAEMEELQDCGVEVEFMNTEEACHGC